MVAEEVQGAGCKVPMRAVALGCAMAGLLAERLEAHGLGAEALHRWPFEPITLTLVVASAVVYGVGTRRLWKRAGVDRGIRRWQAVAFAVGLLSLAVALLSPIVWLSEVLFSVHMTQHAILMLVAAPLIVFGHPLLAAVWAMPRDWRESTGRWTHDPRFASVWRALSAPLSVFVLHGLALWLWHIPVLYDAALASDGIHALEHFSFVATAALFWWGMAHGRYGRLGYGVAVLYVFLTAVHSSVLGALMAIAPTVWYSPYTAAAGIWHVDPLVDQQLAGLLMWVPSGVIFIVLGLALFAAWLGESERRVAFGSVGAPRRLTAGARDAT